ncbi:MAG: cytochrome c [Candidatus Kapabacteria bacterium]|nr:cytochrome c [Candidatus Kapabacteria bacterium]
MRYAIVAMLVFSIAYSSPLQAQDKANGQKVYNEYCKTCHQDGGKGLGTIYPPLAKSDYLKSKPKAEIIKSVVGGLKGEITVNGKKYNGVMAPLPAKYTDKDAADVLTFVYSSWGNTPTVVTPAEVKKVRPAKK